MAGRRISVPGQLYEVLRAEHHYPTKTGQEKAAARQRGIANDLTRRGLTVSFDEVGTAKIYYPAPVRNPGQVNPEKRHRKARPGHFILVLEYGAGPPVVVLDDEQGALLIEHYESSQEEMSEDTAEPIPEDEAN